MRPPPAENGPSQQTREYPIARASPVVRRGRQISTAQLVPLVEGPAVLTDMMWRMSDIARSPHITLPEFLAHGLSPLSNGISGSFYWRVGKELRHEFSLTKGSALASWDVGYAAKPPYRRVDYQDNSVIYFINNKTGGVRVVRLNSKEQVRESRIVRNAQPEAASEIIIPYVETGRPVLGILHLLLNSTELFDLYNNNRERFIELAKYIDFLMNTVGLKRKADYDGLTGLPNRRMVELDFSTRIRILCEEGIPFCVARGDLDHFKHTNDTHGHPTGDIVLVTTSSCLLGSLSRFEEQSNSDKRMQRRRPDFVAREGGEEFCLHLEVGDRAHALSVLERVLANIREAETRTDDGTAIKKTMSIGAVFMSDLLSLPMEQIAELAERYGLEGGTSKAEIKTLLEAENG